MKSIPLKLCILLCLLLIPMAARAQAVKDLPSKDEPLNVRVNKFDEVLRGNHMNEGLIVPEVVLPPAGLDTPVIGNYQNSAMATGVYLAGLAFHFAVDKDPAVQKAADAVMDAILKLEEVTGQPGCVARGLYKTDKPLWHEQAFFLPLKWHDSTSMQGYRWLGDASVNQLVGLAFGISTYWELCADDAHKKTAADFLERMVGRCLENNFKIVNPDGKMTTWGNLCPDLPHEKLSALLALACFKAATQVTEQQTFHQAYHRLITKYKYDDEAILAKVLWPAEWRNEEDDRLASMALYLLMRFEDDNNLLLKYRMCLNRHWYLWKDGTNPFFPMLYQALLNENVVNDAVVSHIKQMLPPVSRRHATWTYASPDGEKKVEGDCEDAHSDMIMNYWFGRYFKMVDPAW